MLAVRSAVNEHGWEVLLNGCQRYKDFAQASGREGTAFIQTPERFIAERSFLEDFGYEAPKTREQIASEAASRADGERLQRAQANGARLGLSLRPLESVGSFETRIRLAETGHRTESDGYPSANGRPTAEQLASKESIGRIPENVAIRHGTRQMDTSDRERTVMGQVASLAGRMRVGK